MSGDYSRKTFVPKKNHSGVLMQQGKVQLDADWNEQVELNDRRWRAETVDIVGRAVVPKETKDGFRIELDAGNLLIHPGRMYVDGLLAENHGKLPRVFDEVLSEEKGSKPIPYDKQPYLKDTDNVAPLPQSGKRLVYLDVWQREVTHLQDPGLVEKAVGIDTTTRLQTVWQVKTTDLGGADINCEVELEDFFDPSAGRLSSGPVAVNTDPDPCRLPPQGGYQGLENRLYRVEIHKAGTPGSAKFKWARDNASVATAVTHIDGKELTVVQSQWDAFRRFNVDDWVEITDDVREFAGEAGEMRQVKKVDYATQTLTLNSALPAADFPTEADKSTKPKRHTRIRKWDQQKNVDANGLLDVTNASIELEKGVQIDFSLDPNQPGGEFKVGDYWLFAARTTSRWVEKLDKAPPRGIHHHYAKLAVVEFPNTFIDDCRIHWPPRITSEGCCTVTVGDGVSSHGDYQKIQQALDSLPASGGKVCVLPGIYHENLTINGRSGVILEGCGERSRVIATAPADEFADADPVIYIVNSQAIRIGALALEAHPLGNGVLVEETAGDPDGPAPLPVEDIEMTTLSVHAATRSAIEVREGKRISICESTIEMLDVKSDWPGIFLVGEDSLIENNTIIMEPGKGVAGLDDVGLANVGRGGIQLGGTCDSVRVLDNLIQGGVGNGITLGSLREVKEDGTIVAVMIGWAARRFDPCKPCEPDTVYIPPVIVVGGGDEPTSHYESTGPLYDIVIERNRIYDMGLNGIGVVGFFDPDNSDELITIERLLIRANDIRHCLSEPLADIPDEMVDHMGYGGIALADVEELVIQHNAIEDNGPNHLEPVCGVFVLHGEGVDISDNRIINNGAKTAASEENAKPGQRAGIDILQAVVPTEPISSPKLKIEIPLQSGVPAVKVHDNIVSQPLGRALSVTVLGPISVMDNQFTSRGVVPGDEQSLWAATVMIANLGVSDELYLQQLMTFSSMRQTKGEYLYDEPKMENNVVSMPQAAYDGSASEWVMANGNVLFCDNQCRLDLVGTDTNAVFSSVMIFSLDDIGFHNNQCDCRLDLFSGWDFVFFPVFLLSATVRFTGNRMKEGVFNAMFSAFSWGLFMNTATSNQSTHCLLIPAALLPGATAKDHNIALIDPAGTKLCERFGSIGYKYQTTKGVTYG